ncbi:hypothetical protein JG687_00001463 [Phytophthora cactorum]|uniref:IQCH-like ATP-grasp domain-containing protein n=1 Tax=Phytophthora cactorum TaxID=29920 RepID=A0A8T1UZY0_9STRA|nr:hypothetical protein JG687_00001463 [Phytophthora cactorum]
MEKVQQQHHVEDVGRLLLQTQEQLRVMREQMTAAAAAVEANASPMRHSAVVTTAEVQAFNAILQQTESELRAKAELVLNGMVNSSSSAQNNQTQNGTLLPAVTVATPPSIKHRSGYSGACKPRQTDASSIPMEFFREEDAKHGVLNLVTRGFLPAYADLTPAFAVSNVAAFTNQGEEDMENNRDRFSDNDVSDEEQENEGNDKDEGAEMEELGANVDKIRGYNELLDAYSLHQFLIHKGRTMRDIPEFVSFRRVAQELWGSVEEALRALETLLTQYFVPLAYVDGQRLLALADQRLAMALDLPILGAPPAQALPLLTRSGGKRLLIRADVNVPTGTYELYDEHELCAALAKLAIAHMEQPRWLIKLDYDPLGVGEAIVDLSSMQAMRELRREKRTPEYWRQPGPRDAAAKLILAELERPGMLARLATPMHSEMFPTWREYIDAIGHFGCVIEVVPPTASTETPTVLVEPAYVRANLFVNPDGSVHVTSTQNVLATGSGRLNRKTVAFTFPQTAAPHEAIKGACNAAGKLLVETNIWGYVSLDFVVFQDDRSHGAPRLWALAVHPFLTDSAASFACFHLLARGVLDANSGAYRVANKTLAVAHAGRSGSGSATDLLLREASLAKGSFAGAPRCFVVCSYVFHPHVTTMQYTAFFHACRLHGVCFDVDKTLGTLFLLADSLTAGVFGILSIGETTEGALAFLRTALEVIGREAGSTIDMASSPSRPVSARSGNFAQVLSAVRASTGGGKSDRLGKMRRRRR